MLKLGLGLGLSSPSTSAAVSAAWGSWDGTNDGAVTNRATGGGLQGQDVVMVSDTEAVMVYRDTDNSGKAVVLDITDKVVQDVTTNTPVTLTEDIPSGINVVKLSDTKFLALYEASTASEGIVVLLTKSGKTLTETDVEVLGLTTGHFHCALTELSTTTAAGVMRDAGDSNNGKVFVVDITGDTISVGSFVSVGTTDDYPAICKGQADGSGFFVANTDTPALDSAVRYFSVSGTTATQQARIDVDAASTQYDDMMAAYIADGICCVAYEKNSTSNVDANAFYWNGSTLTRGTAVTGIFGSNNLFTGTGTVTELNTGSRQAMFSGRLEDETPKNGGAVVVTVNESLVCSKGSVVDIFPSITADHVTIDVSPSGNYVIGLCQDETTVPVKQLGTRIMQGF